MDLLPNCRNIAILMLSMYLCSNLRNKFQFNLKMPLKLVGKNSNNPQALIRNTFL